MARSGQNSLAQGLPRVNPGLSFLSCPFGAGPSGHKAGAKHIPSRRDGAIVARHEVRGKAPPQQSRPVGYGMIRAGVHTDTMIGVDEIPKTKTERPKKAMLYDFGLTGISCARSYRTLRDGSF